MSERNHARAAAGECRRQGHRACAAIGDGAKAQRRADGDAVHRISDPSDRRRVLVAPSEMAVKVGMEAYGPIQEAGMQMLRQFSEAEKQVVLRFIRQAIEMQERELERLLQQDKG